MKPHPEPLLDAETPARLASGLMTATEAVEGCLERIAAGDNKQDGGLEAFVELRIEGALGDAHRLDQGSDRGPLFGVPFAVKDTIDTVDLPTQHNSPLYEGFQPAKDAACVELLRQAGAVLIGKVATVEFASLGALPPTKNPYDPERTPGGSSAGSGAAVGGGLVPLALGTQTGGSTIRPASFCGAVAMKPTYGRVPFEGVKPYAPSIDTLGWICSSVDLARAAGMALGITDGKPSERRKSYNFGLYKTPYWDQAEPETIEALNQTVEKLRTRGYAVTEVADPCKGADLNHFQDLIMHGEGRQAFLAEYGRDYDRLHQGFRDEVENTRGITAPDLVATWS